MFNDPKLNELIKSSEEKCKEHLEMLDCLSSDILKAEGILKRSAIPNVVCYQLPCDSNCYLQLESSRIVFVNNEMNLPLIETPINIRLKCKPYLADFFQECLKTLGE